MKAEEFYKKRFGDAECISRESVIGLLNGFARVLQKERGEAKNKDNSDLKVKSGKRAPVCKCPDYAPPKLAHDIYTCGVCGGDRYY